MTSVLVEGSRNVDFRDMLRVVDLVWSVLGVEGGKEDIV